MYDLRDSVTGALLALLLAVPAATAQDAPRADRGRGWLGVEFDPVFVEEDLGCSTAIQVRTVLRGAPADRAGLRGGDRIVEVDGHPVSLAWLQRLPQRLSSGDTLRLHVRREDTRREVAVVAAARPVRPPAPRPPAPPDRASGTRVRGPILHLEDDKLVITADGLDAAVPAASRGVWLARDGEMEFVRLRPLDGDGMVRRVRNLLECVDRSRAYAAMASAPRIIEIQVRADSLRRRMARQALDATHVRIRLDSLRSAIARQGGDVAEAWIGPGPAPDGDALVRIERDAIRRLEEGVEGVADSMRRIRRIELEGLRGPDGEETMIRLGGVPGQLRFIGSNAVYGAEFVPLNEDLAAYFDGARSGLLVVRVGSRTPAERAGLRSGDVVVAAAGERLERVAELRALVWRGDGAIELRILRRGETRTITLERE